MDVLGNTRDDKLMDIQGEYYTWQAYGYPGKVLHVTGLWISRESTTHDKLIDIQGKH